MYKDKVVCITGAARGIGQHLVRRFLEEEAYVVINYRGETDIFCAFLQQLDQLGYGGRYLAVQADVREEKDVKALFGTIKATYACIDVLINNAGITRDGMFMMMSADNWDDVIATNLRGTFLCSKAALWMMCNKKSGTILNLSSISGIRATTGQANYAASKAGIIMLTKVLAREYGMHNITVNAIAPGFITTDMTAELPENVVADYIEKIPLKTFGTVDDVAELALFLCCERAKYITGQCIEIDGGLGV